MAPSAVATAICAALAFATASLGLPSPSTKVVHEKRDVIHGQWTKLGRANAESLLTLRIGLIQSNLHRGDELINAVAHPESATYGQHLSPQQVIDLFAPSDDAIKETEQWLLSEGVKSDQITLTTGRNWIKVSTTVGKAESLLDTSYNVFENADGARVVACEAYSIPAAIQSHIDLVAPTIQFDEREAVVVTRRHVGRRDGSIASKFKKLPPHSGVDADSLKNCSGVTTPACLRAM
jgi:tripeptidyl-peptidase-1